MNTYKIGYTALLLAASAFFPGCTQNDILYDADYNVTLDPSNTYYAGEPVIFNFTGNIDNILFYSGEAGSEYQYRDRYTVPVDNIEAAYLTLDILPQYGSVNGGLDVYYSDTFNGLEGDDADADKTTLSSMSEDMSAAGWTQIAVWDADNPEKASTPVSKTVDVSDVKENFTLAFHWRPTSLQQTNVQRTYNVNGTLSVVTKDYGTIETDLSEFVFTTVMMNEEFSDPYINSNGNGTIRFDDSTYDIKFQGVAADVLSYDLDGWCVSVAMDFNSIPNDKGTVIKNMQNYLTSYSYTFEEPGTYTVTFIGRNYNYVGLSEQVRQLTVTILPPQLD